MKTDSHSEPNELVHLVGQARLGYMTDIEVVNELESRMQRRADEAANYARIIELAMFARKFVKQEDLGSTPSDLMQGDSYIDADGSEMIDYIDDRLEALNSEAAS